MALNYRSVDRVQAFLLPPDVRDWLPANHLVWFLLEVVEGLDTLVLEEGSKRGGIGREGYDPAMLLGLWIYASARGISSSRQIERLCTEDIAFRVLCAQDVPDHTVLARFRQRHQDAMAGLFGQVLALCVGQGLGRFGVIAIDGTKIKANAAKGKTVTLKRLRKLAALELAKAAVTDAAEDAANAPAAGDDLPPGFGPGSGRAARIAEAIKDIEAVIEADNAPDLAKFQARLEAAETALASLQAASEARVRKYEEKIAAGKPPSGRSPVLENTKVIKAQNRVAHGHALIATAQARKASQLEGIPAPGRTLAKRNTTDPQSRLMITRDGFMQAYNVQVVAADDQLILAVDATDDPNDLQQYLPMVAQAEASLAKARGTTSRTDLELGVVTADTGYLSAENVSATGPERLISPGRGHFKDEEWTGKRERRDGSKIPHHAQVMLKKLDSPENQKTYRRRSPIVEPINARLKDLRGLRQFSRRGKDAVNGEIHLAALTTNLLKVFTTVWQPAHAFN